LELREKERSTFLFDYGKGKGAPEEEKIPNEVVRMGL